MNKCTEGFLRACKILIRMQNIIQLSNATSLTQNHHYRIHIRLILLCCSSASVPVRSLLVKTTMSLSNCRKDKKEFLTSGQVWSSTATLAGGMTDRMERNHRAAATRTSCLLSLCSQWLSARVCVRSSVCVRAGGARVCVVGSRERRREEWH